MAAIQKEGDIDTAEVRTIKGLIRRGEARTACTFKGNTTPQYRCDDVTTFEEGGMQDEGEPLVTCKYQAILYCEIVSCLAVTGMRPGMYNPVKSTLGITVQAAGGDPERRTLVRAGIRTDF